MAQTPVPLAADQTGDSLMANAAGDSLLAAFAALPPQAPTVSTHTVADFLAAMQSLMPRGRVWRTDIDAVQTEVLTGLVQTLTRLEASAARLVVDMFAPTSINLLAEWEASLGLPDPCAGLAPTLQLRQAQVLAKFANYGGQSVSYFVNLASELGYAISITEFTAPGDPHHWQVNCGVPVTFFRVGQSAVGEPLVDGDIAVLECVFREYKPAHTSVSFVYA